MSVLRGRVLALYVGCCLVWGSTWLAIKIGLQDLPPLWFAGIRMGVAWLLLTPIALATSSRKPAPAQKKWIVLGGLLQIGLQYVCIFTAEQWIDSGLAALLFATFPIFVGVFAHFLLPEEPLTRRTLASAALGLLGVAVIEAPSAKTIFSTETRLLLLGSALMLLASATAAVANVLNKKHLSDVSPLRNVWAQTFVGSSLLLALAAAVERGAVLHWTPKSLGALLYLAIFGTALPFVGLFWLLPRIPVAVIGMIPVIDTVIAVILGSLVLSEAVSGRVLVGGALILVGVLLVARPGVSADRSAATPA
jgi:drug/metabolite transporter (DMT)-like permease